VFLPLAFPCSPYDCIKPTSSLADGLCANSTEDHLGIAFEEEVEHYTCKYQQYNLTDGSVFVNGTFSQVSAHSGHSEDSNSHVQSYTYNE
jgi:hypothetical protein